MSGYNYLGRSDRMKVLYPNYGDVILDTNDNKMKVFDGISWQYITSQPKNEMNQNIFLETVKNFLTMKGIDIQEFEEYLEAVKVANKLSDKE